jgi:Leucine-rich repeat (LRR) protein
VLSQLSRLDLSQSGLVSIPGGDLCALTALTHLNLSANRLQDIADLGLQLPASGCSLPLGSLDLSGTSLLMPRPCSCTPFI